jgi:signal transduction histidine kinase/ligand-binding sensor domain-containing protein
MVHVVLTPKPFVLALLLAAPLMALDPHTKITDLVHTKWSGADVPFGWVIDLAQTKDGSFWVATDQALFRFDGVRFTRLEALSKSRISHLLATHDGSLWVVFRSGRVSRLSEGNITTFPLEELPQTNTLAEDRDGSIVAATIRGGLARFRDGHWREAARALHHSAKFSRNVWFDREGALWLITEDRLLKLLPGADHFSDPGLPARLSGSEQPFAESQEGTVWFADRDSVRGITPAGAKTVVQLPVQTLALDRQGSLWVGSVDRGLIRIPTPASAGGKEIAAFAPLMERLTRRDGLSGDRVYCVMEDREGNVWIGTDQGLDRFREGIFHRVEVPDVDRITWMMNSREGGLLLVKPSEPVLQRINPDGNIVTLRLPEPAIGTCQDTDGTIWLSTSTRFGRWTGKGIWYPPQVHGGSILQFRCGYGDVWIGNAGQGIIRFSGGKAMSVPGLRIGGWNALFVEGPGRAWVPYSDGKISVYDNGTIREYGKKDGLPEEAIFTIAKSVDGDLWFAGDGGLARFRNDRFETVDVAPGNHLAAAEPAEDGSLWLKSSGALMKLDSREFDRAVAHPGYRPHLERYGTLDGIPGSIIQIASSGQRVWVLTSEGLGYLNLNLHVSRNAVPPPVRIETFTLDGKTQTASRGMVLPRLTHNLQIDYTAFSLTVPERVQFRYQLEGVDKDWQPVTTRRQATYTDPPPGKRRFLVKASNNDGVWNEAGATLDFSIAPAYYQTHWFQAACIVAFLASLWGLYRLRLRQVAHQMTNQFNVRLEERVGERTRIARELHDTLIQSFQGTLFEFQAARNLFVRRPEDAIRTLDEAIGSARAAIAEGREAIQNLRSRSAIHNDLAYLLRATGRELLDGQESQGRAGFRLTVEGPPQTLSPVLQDEIYRIGREILRNAFRHACAKQIEVEIRYDAQEFRVRIRDDGIGIDPKVLGEGARPEHWGLPGVRERAKLVAAKLDFWSEAGAGTEVQLTVPASVAYVKPRQGRVFGLFRGTRSHAE